MIRRIRLKTSMERQLLKLLDEVPLAPDEVELKKFHSRLKGRQRAREALQNGT